MTTWPSLVGTAAPPRDPNVDDDEEEEDDDEVDMTASQRLSESQTKTNRSILLRTNC